MKLQDLTVIFAIIIIPLTLILSAYIGIQIDTASLQQSYNTQLMDATHDAVIAFELNTANNAYSTNTDSMRRDITASIRTFFTSLASGLGLPGANYEGILPYVPAILITLYDGYYIYSPSEYNYQTKEQLESGTWTEVNKTGYTHILKPYVYYSATYKSGGDYIVVNYTLDNYVTLYGQIGGQSIAKSGYLSTDDFLNNVNTTEGEVLRETIVYKDSSKRLIKRQNCTFVYQDGLKVYNIEGKWYTITGENLVEYNYTGDGKDHSAREYVKSSREFMQYLNTPINGKTISSIVLPKNQVDGTNESIERIFDSDPEDQTSIFNQHKREVIRKSIQDNMNNAMALYNVNSGSMGLNATFAMPILSEGDWEKIITNVNIVSFMQGLPVGTKVYNDYSIVTSTNNKQYVGADSILFVKDGKYHTIYHLAEFAKDLSGIIGYKVADFKKVKYNAVVDDNTVVRYYYRRMEYSCYDCVVSTNVVTANSGTEYGTMEKLLQDKNIKKLYYTALARERYNLDKVTKIFL